jgi:hypothetical protein
MRRSGSGLVLSLVIACAFGLGGAGCKLDLMREEIRFGDAGTETKICDGPQTFDASQASAMPSRITRTLIDDVDAGASPGEAICDGSDAVRLGVAMGPGPLSTFSEPYAQFFVLDGHCHFYATESGMLGVREGVLSARQADALAIDLAIPWLATLSSTRATCTDDPGTLIATATSTLSCSCGDCGSDSGATTAMQHARAWIRDLTLVGSEVTGSVRALATLREPPAYGCYADEIVAWPLGRAMRDVNGLIADQLTLQYAGARFDDAQDILRLRQLRAAAYTAMLARMPYPEHVYVRDADADYALDVRDELPDGYEQAVADFLHGAREQEDTKLSASSH